MSASAAEGAPSSSASATEVPRVPGAERTRVSGAERDRVSGAERTRVSGAKRDKQVGRYTVKRVGKGRQFRSDFLEKFSHCNPMMPLYVYAPVVVGAWYLARTDTALGLGAQLAWFLLGVAIWSLAEYVLHRFVFHFDQSPKLHFFLHGIHHEYPNDHTRLVMPPGASGVMAVLFWFLFRAVTGYEVALPAFAGFVAGYVWYDTTHYWAHIARPTTRWGRLLRRHHMQHHYATPHIRFGVSTPLWDVVFGTYKDKPGAAPDTEAELPASR